MSKLEIAARVLILLYLLTESIADLKCRRVSLLPALILLPAGLLARLIEAGAPGPTLLTGLVPGLLLLIAAGITKESVGLGDAVIVLACGAWLSGSCELECLCLALLLSAAVSIALLLLRRCSRQDTLPFLPFLLAGHAAVFLLG